MHRGSLSLTSSQTFVIFALFGDSHSDGCEVISHCTFDLHFPDDEDCLASFPEPMLPLHFFFGDKYLFSSSAHFKNQVLYCFIVELYECLHMLHLLFNFFKHVWNVL